jgi:tRNA(adenine34) deaminase
MSATKTDEYFMALAIKQAQLALEEGMFPVGAVIVHEGNIVARRHKFKGGIQSLDHAEQLAIRDAIVAIGVEKSGLTVYSTLEPCTMCFGTMLNVRARRVVFALEDPFDGYALMFGENHATTRHKGRIPEVVCGVCREDSRRLFARYFRTTTNEFWRNAHDNPFVRICAE